MSTLVCVSCGTQAEVYHGHIPSVVLQGEMACECLIFPKAVTPTFIPPSSKSDALWIRLVSTLRLPEFTVFAS